MAKRSPRENDLSFPGLEIHFHLEGGLRADATHQRFGTGGDALANVVDRPCVSNPGGAVVLGAIRFWRWMRAKLFATTAETPRWSALRAACSRDEPCP